MEIVSQNSFSL